MPLFLNLWSPKVSLRKEGIKSVPIWVKLHNVPISVYTDDGLSLLASKLGVPKSLDSYTADMCADFWGRSSYARALIEISAENDFKDHITIAIPKMDEEGYILEQVKVEYEWKPLRCATCCLFGHDANACSKGDKGKAKHVVIDDEGFVTDRKRMAKQSFPQKKQKPRVIYRPKLNKSGASTSGTKKDELEASGRQPAVNIENKFQVLDMVGDGDGEGSKDDNKTEKSLSSGSHRNNVEVMDQLQTEISDYMGADMRGSTSEGASTPGNKGVDG
ncbi:uncharacterized protein LOC110881951 [Helianthus annuus]|uniref:uncharacterized protein LOC110881951 n=1 Tax=Helianthus annuus TaxID=4232 RepID=UPI000B8F4AE8|nr:uncharacterized protein LOC110881951 [Helianthus annuus]